MKEITRKEEKRKNIQFLNEKTMIMLTANIVNSIS